MPSPIITRPPVPPIMASRRDDLYAQAEFVTDHGEQRAAPPDGQRAADGEQHTRARDGDYDADQSGEREHVTERHHEPTLGRPSRPAPANFPAPVASQPWQPPPARCWSSTPAARR